MNSQRIPKNSLKIPKIHKKISKNSKKKNSKKNSKKIQKNSQDFEHITNVNFPITYIHHLEAENPFRLVWF